LSQIQDVLERLQTKVVEDKKIQLELSKILDKVAASSMEDDKKNEVLNILVEIDNDLVSATKLLEDRMLQIENLKK
jgi:hypothetical protein